MVIRYIRKLFFLVLRENTKEIPVFPWDKGIEGYGAILKFDLIFDERVMSCLWLTIYVPAAYT